MKFTKMQGIGNDYVYVNGFEEKVSDKAAAARFVSDRHFGIGSDGLIFINPSDIADFEMEMYNSDGSGSEMCGNGIRCVAKYVYDNGLTDKTTITIASGGSVKTLELKVMDGKVKEVKVNMGSPILTPSEIPVDLPGDRVVDVPISTSLGEYHMTCVSMGNPHAVVFVDDVDALDLPVIGPVFENHELFPNRTNTEFVQVVDDTRLKMRVWERGAGETLACGTGACASLAAAVLNKKTKNSAQLSLRGGELFIEWSEASNEILMTGPAETVFTGEIDLPL